MSFIKSAVLALAAATPLVSASPVARQFRNGTEFAILDAPIAYSGPYTSFPSMDTWKTFNELVSIPKFLAPLQVLQCPLLRLPHALTGGVC